MSLPPSTSGSPPREHHFYVAFAKCVFVDAADRIVWSEEPVRLAAAATVGLRPVILYGVTVSGTPIHWLTYVQADRPRSLADVVHEAWKQAPGLRGYPDNLTLNRHVVAAAPGFVQRMRELGIGVTVAGPSDKRLSASLRVAQQAIHEIRFRARNRSSIETVEDLNAESAALHASHVKLGWRRGIAARATAERSEAWMTLPARGTPAMSAGELDWAPGPWLSAWEASLPPGGPQALEDKEGGIWLRACHEEAPDEDRSETHAGSKDAKILVDAWPNEPSRIANAIGVTTRQLQWYLAGRASIPPDAESRLRSLLGLEYRPERGAYEPAGPCVLIGHSTRVAVEAYEALSHGGDLEYSVEPVPDRGSADPSWRYLLFQPFGEFPSVIMLARGSRTVERLGERFINFDGTRSIPARVYRDLVSACGRACADPVVNRRELIEFAERHDEWLEAWSEDR